MGHSIKAHRRRGSARPAELDTCRTGPVDAERMKKELALTYERFCLAAEGESSTSSDEDLIEALENCWTRSPSSPRLTELETLRRLCGACYFRLQSGKQIEVPDDLAYLTLYKTP